MKFGFGLPSRDSLATASNLKTLAQRGEDLGFSTVSVSEHIVMPVGVNSPYPYSECSTFAGEGSGE